MPFHCLVKVLLIVLFLFFLVRRIYFLIRFHHLHIFHKHLNTDEDSWIGIFLCCSKFNVGNHTLETRGGLVFQLPQKTI